MIDIEVTVAADGCVSALRTDSMRRSPAGRVRFEGLDRQLVRHFERLLAGDEWTLDGSDVRMVGSFLHRCLFPETVWAWIMQQIDGDDEVVFRLQLILPAEEPFARMSAVPWEYLYSPESALRGGWFLAAHPHIVFSRYIPLNQPSRQFPPVSRVKILVVISDPDPRDLGPVEYSDTLAEIKKTAKLLDFDIEVLKNPTAEKLRQAVVSPHPAQLLHFIGHGRFQPEEDKASLALGKADGTTDWVDDRRLAEILTRGINPPRIVVLHACEGAKANFEASFAGLAPQLVRGGIQCVVAMQYPVTNETATAFSVSLFKELAAGSELDRAVQEARWQIGTFGLDDVDPKLVGVPVIYLQSSNPLIRSLADGEGPADA